MKRLGRRMYRSKRRTGASKRPTTFKRRIGMLKNFKRKMMCFKPEVKRLTNSFDAREIYNYFATGVDLPNNASLYLENGMLSDIQPGTNDAQRLGNSIHFISVRLKGLIALLNSDSSTNGDNPVVIRVSLVSLKGTNAPTLSANIQKLFSDSQHSLPAVKFYDRSDVNVYYDRLISRAPTTSQGLVSGNAMDTPYIPINVGVKFNRKVIFDDQPTAGGDYPVKHMKNNLFWLIYGYKYGAGHAVKIGTAYLQNRMYFSDA